MSPIPTDFCKVLIEGLQKFKDVKQDDWTATMDSSSGLYTLSMTLRRDELVWPGLWEKFEGTVTAALLL